MTIFLSTLSLRRATTTPTPCFPALRFLSTLSLRRATSAGGAALPRMGISIHALLAESDGTCPAWRCSWPDFYPRSPCGERHPVRVQTKELTDISIHALLAESDSSFRSAFTMPANFYPRSPCGERPWQTKRVFTPYLFLSTLSLRRATLLDIVVL